jgi:antitoxin PrlF
MAESRVTARGRTTVPAKVMNALGAGPGTRLEWHLLSTGAVLVRARSKSIVELAGSLSSGGPPVRIEEMNPWRD